VASFSVEGLLESGVHFGHKVSRWNPRMEPYIFAKRNQIHIIDLKETVKGIIRASHFLTNVVAEGGEVLFVGTKRQARSAVESEGRRCEMHIVTDRWIGGTLTNFNVIRSRLKRLLELEAMEEDGSIKNFSKKMVSSLRREMRKIKRNLDGIRRMEKIPAVMVVIDPSREINAVREANKMNVPVIAIIDTDGDPKLVDIPIPGNDDAIRSIQTILEALTDAVLKGKELRIQREEIARKAAEEEAQRRKAEEAHRRAKAEAERKAAEEAAAKKAAEAKAAAEPATGEKAQKTAEAKGTPAAKPKKAPEQEKDAKPQKPAAEAKEPTAPAQGANSDTARQKPPAAEAAGPVEAPGEPQSAPEGAE